MWHHNKSRGLILRWRSEICGRVELSLIKMQMFWPGYGSRLCSYWAHPHKTKAIRKFNVSVGLNEQIFIFHFYNGIEYRLMQVIRFKLLNYLSNNSQQ